MSAQPTWKFRTDPDRENERMNGLTGIYIRAVGKDGHIGPYDLAELDFDSLTAWLKRDGGDNLLAENTVRCLLGHEQLSARARGEGGVS